MTTMDVVSTSHLNLIERARALRLAALAADLDAVHGELCRPGADGDGDCTCLARSDELFFQLTRQARLENDLLVARST